MVKMLGRQELLCSGLRQPAQALPVPGEHRGIPDLVIHAELHEPPEQKVVDDMEGPAYLSDISVGVQG